MSVHRDAPESRQHEILSPTSNCSPSTVVSLPAIITALFLFNLSSTFAQDTISVAGIKVTPSAQSVTAGETVSFKAGSGTVLWSVTPPVGSISTTGVYSAPPAVSTSQTITVIAKNISNPSQTSTAIVTVYPNVSISVTPPYGQNLTAGDTLAYAATVTGSADTGVVWSLTSTVGTLSQSGFYTAPSTVSSLQSTYLRVTSKANPLKSVQYWIRVYPKVTVGITPEAVTLQPGQTRTFAAAVTGYSTDKAVTWSVSPAVGTISTTGVYKAPPSILSAQTVTVTAKSVANPFRCGTAVVIIAPSGAVNVTVSPASGTLKASRTVSLTAAVTGSTNTGVVWSFTPNVGTLSTNGNAAVYTAPSSVSADQTVEVQATSMADPTKFASAAIMLVTAITVSVAPSTVELSPGETHQFTATVAGTTNTAVGWSITPSIGQITSTGLYTAPPNLETSNSVSITATSLEHAQATNTAAVSIIPKTIVRLNSTGVASLTYRGQEYLLPGSGVPKVIQMYLRNGAGTVTAASTTPLSTTVNTTANRITSEYPWGRMVIAYTTVADRLSFTLSLTNTTSEQTLDRFWIFPLGIQFPTPVANITDPFRSNIDAPSVISWNHGSKTVALVNEDVIKPLGVAFWQAESPAATKWNVSLQTGKVSGMTTPSIIRNVPPGTTDTISLSLRFADGALTAQAIAPDVYERYRETFPMQVPRPIRKPIAQLMTTGRFRPHFANNPRGWFNDPNINVFSPAGVAAFQSRLLRWADEAVTEMLRVGAQGGILWDLEGQQFDQAYIGDPTQLETLAPELIGVLDAFVQRFQKAGLKIGFTLRPQVFTSQTGTANVSGNRVTLVSGTPFSPSWVGQQAGGILFIDGQNYTIKTVDSSTSLTLTTSPRTSTNLPFSYPLQVNTTDPGAVLKAKVQYAVNRWGATLFYVDSNLDWEGNVNLAETLKQIIDSYPNVMIFPEWKSTKHFAYSYPYLDSTLGPTYHRTSDEILSVYPTATSLINIPGDPMPIKDRLVQAVRQGDILLFGGWYRHPANDAVMQIYAESMGPM